jgi:hypothetical protein
MNHHLLKLLLLTVAVWICVACSPNRTTYHRAAIVLDSACTAGQQAIAREVINKRIASVWKVKEVTALVDGRFDITYSGSDSLLARMLTQRGEVYVSEMYQNSELHALMLPVYTEMLSFAAKTAGHTIRFSDPASSDVPFLRCVPQQIAYVDSVLDSKKHLFPAYLHFCWSAKPSSRGIVDAGEPDYFALLPLRRSSLGIPFNPNTVKTVDDYDNTNYGYRAITIELTEAYAGKWADLTRENISRPLAIVMDGKALSWPIVQSEITGGMLQITGDDDMYEDFFLIQSVISGGTLDCTARVISSPGDM